MKAVNLSDVKLAIISKLNRAICAAKSNLTSRWIDGSISEQQLDDTIIKLDNVLSLAKVAINNAGCDQEIDEVCTDFIKHLKNLVQ